MKESTKKMILYSVIFGVISGVVCFVLETLLGLNKELVFNIWVTAMCLFDMPFLMNNQNSDPSDEKLKIRLF